ncbi:MAG: hypothetical protein OER43_09985 [Gammaproteobacteria bacterium]|nr:hypothetical protein [Gammaproteobacteria bacterium]
MAATKGLKQSLLQRIFVFSGCVSLLERLYLGVRRAKAALFQWVRKLPRFVDSPEVIGAVERAWPRFETV